jgi:hypothetical protein
MAARSIARRLSQAWVRHMHARVRQAQARVRHTQARGEARMVRRVFGMQPSLALAYASRSKNGHLGVGFQLEGISTIEPCPKTLATEGFAYGVHLDDKDAYCLDGHKLVAIPDGTYRTEDETFTRIVRVMVDGKLTAFSASTREGRTRIYRRPTVTPTRGPVQIAFPVAEEFDRAGNTIRYAYRALRQSSASQGEFGIDRIDYTLRRASVPGLEDGLRSVRFVYEGRPEFTDVAVGGYAIPITMRLSAIELYAPTARAATTSSLAWRYMLSYDASTATGRSLLTGVKRCGALGGCLPQRTFAWEQLLGPTYVAENFPDALGGETKLAADLDGDGREEVVVLGSSFMHLRTTVDPAHPLGRAVLPLADINGVATAGTLPVDLNGDGRVELLAALPAARELRVRSPRGSPVWLGSFIVMKTRASMCAGGVSSASVRCGGGSLRASRRRSPRMTTRRRSAASILLRFGRRRYSRSR